MSTKGAVGDLFGGKAPKAGGKAKKKTRDVISFPPELQEAADVAVASRQFIKTVEKKAKLAETRIKKFCRQWWAEKYAATGIKPEMAHFHGGEGSLDYTQTKRIHLSHEKTQALEMLGVDISEYVITSGIAINMEAVQRLGYMDKLMKAIERLVGENTEHIAEIFTPKVDVKDGILEALPGLCNAALQPGENLAEKIENVVATLGAVDSFRGASIDKTSTECFELVMGAKIEGDGAKS